MPSLPALDIKKNINHSPHVVILGAGASLAAFPGGDASGRSLPLMNNLIDVAGLRAIIAQDGLDPDVANFEAFYDDLVTSGNHAQLVRDIELRIRHYFAEMSLPPEPTIYDYLILSLREKDLIATFNWDPFLAQAFRRNMRVAAPPRVVYLYGNVAIGVCKEHRRVGFLHQTCGFCGNPLSPSNLLYPVKHKDYSADPFIKGEWDSLREFLKRAYYVTIFGYSAPQTDVEAKRLMLEVWKENPTLSLAEVDVIDIKHRDDLKITWKEFLYSHHFGMYRDVSATILYRHPRRSCDAFAMATLQNEPWADNPFPQVQRLSELHEWLHPLLLEEQKGVFSGKPCHDV